MKIMRESPAIPALRPSADRSIPPLRSAGTPAVVPVRTPYGGAPIRRGRLTP